MRQSVKRTVPREQPVKRIVPRRQPLTREQRKRQQLRAKEHAEEVAIKENAWEVMNKCRKRLALIEITEFLIILVIIGLSIYAVETLELNAIYGFICSLIGIVVVPLIFAKKHKEALLKYQRFWCS